MQHEAPTSVSSLRTFPGVASLPAEWGGCVLSVGNFDGVHVGHASILAALRAAADRRGLPAVVLTFDPHPAQTLRGKGPAQLQPLGRRLELLSDFGVDAAVVVGADAGFFTRTARQFVEEILVAGLRTAEVVEGPDFRFGHDRAGDLAYLAEAGSRAGFAVTVVPGAEVRLPGESAPRIAASSLVRNLVAEGRVADAAVVLGRPFEVEGPVVTGARRGRTLGWPTANVELGDRLAPAPGVYAATAEVSAGPGDAPSGATGSLPVGERLPAAVFAGAPPTFPGEPRRVEAYLLDFAGDLYGRRLRLRLTGRIRGLVKFADARELADRIARDVQAVRDAVP